MKFHLTFLFLAGVLVAFVAAAPKMKTKSNWNAVKPFLKIIYREVCKADGENRCVKLTEKTYKRVLQLYFPQIEAKCKEYEVSESPSKQFLHKPCIALINTARIKS